VPIGTSVSAILGLVGIAAIPVSILGFMISRAVLGFGEAGNFPAAIKATAEYFPKKERSFATGIFNSGANVGAVMNWEMKLAHRTTGTGLQIQVILL
jgi:ACS family hexuronate transporter-like MFS transporter